MELWSLWRVVRRRWWLVVIPALVVGVIGLATYRQPPTVYTTSLRFTVGQAPVDPAQAYGYDRYYSWTSSEYIANGLADWVRGGVFASQVSQLLQNRGASIPAGAIQGALVPDNARSLLSLSVTWPDPDGLKQVVPAVVDVLQHNNAVAFPQLGPGGAVVTPIDPVEPVNPVPVAPSMTTRLGLLLRLALALIAGLGLAFLVEYLDPTIRDQRDIDRLGLEIVGEIPGK